jgi:hypothetical protein
MMDQPCDCCEVVVPFKRRTFQDNNTVVVPVELLSYVAVFQITTPLAGEYQHFERNCHLHIQKEVSQVGKQLGFVCV